MAATETSPHSTFGDSSPFRNYAAVTPHDSTNLSFLTRAIYVGTAGNVVAVRQDGTAVTFTNVQNGTVLHIRASRINATNTTASNIVALW